MSYENIVEHPLLTIENFQSSAKAINWIIQGRPASRKGNQIFASAIPVHPPASKLKLQK